MRLWPKLLTEPPWQGISLRAGQHQGVKLQHRIGAAILALFRGQHRHDAALQFHCLVGARKPIRQRHAQHIAARMRGQPGLQFGIDAIHQRIPMPALHGATFLGGDRLTHHFRNSAAAADGQIMCAAFGKAGEAHLKPLGAIKCRAAQQMEKRDQSRLTRKPLGDGGAQLLTARFRQALRQPHRFRREAKRAAFRTALRRAACRACEREFQSMAMLRGAPLKGACLCAAPQICQSLCPKISPDQPQKIRHRLGIGRGFGKRHSKTLWSARPKSWPHAETRYAKPTLPRVASA